MKKNRKVSKKMSVNAVLVTHFGAILGVAFVMVILNLLASTSYKQLMKTIGQQESKLAKLEDDLDRESNRWAEMRTTDKIERALKGFGLNMRAPRPQQNVRVETDGTIPQNQLSVVAFNRRKARRVAQNVGRAR